MTAYFDNLRTQTRELSEQHKDDDAFVEAVGQLEDEVVKIVNLATGDREFPDDLREKIQGIIAVHRINTPVVPNPKARDYCRSVRGSTLLERLHSAFHEVASRRHKTRFGMLFDSPAGIVKCRDAHDKEAFGGGADA